MAREFASRSFFLLQLLLVMCILGSGSCNKDQINERNLLESSNNRNVHASSSPFIVFYRLKDFKKGNKLPLYLPPFDPLSYPLMLRKEVADSIPFSSKYLPSILRYFSYSPDSIQGRAVKHTIKICESPPFEGETQFCATSYQSMVDSVRRIFGSDAKAITSVHLTSSKTHVQNYTILEEPEQILAPKFLGCHILNYPYALYHCHGQSSNKVFRVSLAGNDNGDRIEGIAACHFDTSLWYPNHLAFKETGTKPGQSEICHFFPSDHLVWVPAGFP
ncbi:hypothetical protein JCGZ_10078 [Jatropha curcas]|uniref:BURP domain-containing protein n=1 Tax=Jatropha curcas TaxID=180498 RepID=A0A067LG35_JATCU|nr:hypothetical protein JCGZ_10078 [Jatropha curcas]